MYKIYANGTLIVSSKIEDLSIINPVINLEANKAGTFKFTMPPTHPYYDFIERRTTLIDVYRDDETEPVFEGICVSQAKDFYNQKTFTCEGELTFFNDSFLRPAYRQGQTSRQLLQAYINEHNAQTEEMKHFTIGQVTARDSNDSITCYTNYNSTMKEIKEDLVDDIGGYLRVRHPNGVRTLDYLAESPRTSNQTIRIGHNLMDLSQSISSDDIATVIIPLGAKEDEQVIQGLDKRLDITTAPADAMHPSGADYVYSSTAVSNFGRIEKVVTWDKVTTVSALVAKGKQYLQDIQWENLVIKAKAVDLGITSDQLNNYRLLDLIRVVSEPHGLDRYFMVSKLTINLNNPENDTVTLGITEAKTLSAKSNSVNQQILKDMEQLPTSSQVKQAIDNATALITGAEGGYVVIEKNAQGQPIEIKIQDALNNPTKIWRWNQNGFGYSSDGGQTYGTAITMDGSIVASFITSGVMTAERIRGGSLLVGGSGLGANGEIVIKDSNNVTMIAINKYGMTLYDANGVGKAYLDHSGLRITGGLISASQITGSTISIADPTSGASMLIIDTSGIRIFDASGNQIVTLNPTTLTFDSNNLALHSNAFSLNQDGIYTQKVVTADVRVETKNIECQDCYVHDELYVAGSKHRIVDTDIGWVTYEAYETATPYFGDIGENTLDENGECTITLDDRFLASTEQGYQVFVTPYGEGSLYVSERHDTEFIVKGTPEMKFGYEIKAIQKDRNYYFKEPTKKTIEAISRSEKGAEEWQTSSKTYKKS